MFSTSPLLDLGLPSLQTFGWAGWLLDKPEVVHEIRKQYGKPESPIKSPLYQIHRAIPCFIFQESSYASPPTTCRSPTVDLIENLVHRRICVGKNPADMELQIYRYHLPPLHVGTRGSQKARKSPHPYSSTPLPIEFVFFARGSKPARDPSVSQPHVHVESARNEGRCEVPPTTFVLAFPAALGLVPPSRGAKPLFPASISPSLL